MKKAFSLLSIAILLSSCEVTINPSGGESSDYSTPGQTTIYIGTGTHERTLKDSDGNPIVGAAPNLYFLKEDVDVTATLKRDKYLSYYTLDVTFHHDKPWNTKSIRINTDGTIDFGVSYELDENSYVTFNNSACRGKITSTNTGSTDYTDKLTMEWNCIYE